MDTIPAQTEARQRSLQRQVKWCDIDQRRVRKLIEMARLEDLEGDGFNETPTTTGDVTTRFTAATGTASARLVAREPLVACGLPIVPLVLEAYGQGVFEPACSDGDSVQPGVCLGTLSGPASEILTAERVLLNFIQRLSGVATQTARFASALANSRTRLLDTRKTTPGYRSLEKYAVAVGGGWNHRLGLYDRVMLKDNHWAAGNGLTGRVVDVVRSIRSALPNIPVQIEIDRFDQLDEVIAADPDVILLDNFSNDELHSAVAAIAGRSMTEASGGITEGRLREIAEIGLDFISTGALVHKSVWVDIGLDWSA